MHRSVPLVVLASVLWSCGGTTGIQDDASTTDATVDSMNDTVADTATEPDAVTDPACAPVPAWDDPCIACDAVELLGWFWTGASCVDVWGCSCVGDGCDLGTETAEQCQEAHSGCDGSLCTDTGGTWIPGLTCLTCGHFVCGEAPPEDCCGPGCDCGPGRTFVPGSGCAPDGSCTAEALCRATDGIWYDEEPCGPCGHYHCGEPPMLGCCSPGCDCGASRVFQEGVGCVVSEECGPTRQDICTTTGGTWHPDAPCGPCGDYICSDPSGDACCDAGCDCGPYRVYEPDVGCVHSSACFDRRMGESCSGSSHGSNCRPGLVCCAVSGVMASMQCVAPCCEDDLSCMEDGCPLPPP